MKKFVTAIIMVTMMCGLTACGNVSNVGNTLQEANTTSTDIGKVESKWIEIERGYYEDIEKCIYEIEDMVKNPASLKVKGVCMGIYTEKDGSYSTSYTAGFYVASQNDIGNDKEMYINVYESGSGEVHECYETTDYVYYTDYSKIVKGRGKYQEYYTDEGEGVYSTPTSGGGKNYIFSVDLDDYEAQGYWIKR